MDSANLTYEQLEKLGAQVLRSLQFFNGLLHRIDECQFPYDDDLRQRVTRVCDALDCLRNRVHYLACDRAAGRVVAARGESEKAFRVQCVLDPGAPLAPLEHLDLIEAETPLEAIVKLARCGRLPPADVFYARVLPESGGEVLVVIRLTRTAIVALQR